MLFIHFFDIGTVKNDGKTFDSSVCFLKCNEIKEYFIDSKGNVYCCGIAVCYVLSCIEMT